MLAFISNLFFSSTLFLGRKHGERGVAKNLESLRRENEQYHPFNNIILNTLDGTTQIDHIVISPYGIFVIETKNYKGWIFGGAHQKRWTQTLYGPANSSIKYQFQNPIHQNYKHVKAVQDFLRVNPKAIFNVVVFAGTAEFKTDMPDNVRGFYDLLPYLKSYEEIFFNSETVGELSKKMWDHAKHCSTNEDDHIKNLIVNKMHPICPRCGIPMVLRKARRGAAAGSEFWGCPNFPGCRMTKRFG